MKTTAHSKRTTAFTLVELIVCIVCIVFAVFLFLSILPSLALRHHHPRIAACTGNLKQLGLAVRTYALDNEDRFPWGIPVSEGGTKELAEPFLSDDLTPSISAKEIDLNQITSSVDWYRTNNLSKDLAFSYHFMAMSNEISDFRILICPHDSVKKKFKKIKDSQYLFKNPDGGRFNISYFINLEVPNAPDYYDPTKNSFLFGDRNLLCSRLPIMTNSVNPILFQRGTEPDTENFSDIQWTPELHTDRGNVTFADGSVQEIINPKLQSYLAQSTNSFNRIVLPFGKRP